MFKDTYDLEVTCSSDAAFQAYLSGTECSLRFDQPAISELTEAVTLDDDFALAHVALARQFLIHGLSGDIDTHLNRALELKDRVTPREQGTIDVAERAARFDPQAIAMARSHVETYPRDVFVLAHLLGPFGLLAFSGTKDWCAQNVALLDATRSSYRDDDWWHLTTSGFFAAEQGKHSQARNDCERAWLVSENGNCAHSMAHMHFEAGALEEGRAFINDWISEYGDHSDMRHHLAWHISLLDLETGVNPSETLKLYAQELDPTVSEPTPLETFCDNASFLWRCHLLGEDVPAEAVADMFAYGEENFGAGGFAFADIHRAMMSALRRDKRKHEVFVKHLAGVAEKRATTVAESVRIYAESFGAFANENYNDTVTMLEPALSGSVMLGGSNPQRRIVEETFLQACLRAKKFKKVRALIEARKRSDSNFDKKLLDDIRILEKGCAQDGCTENDFTEKNE